MMPAELLKNHRIALRALEPSDMEFLKRVENNPLEFIDHGLIYPFSDHVLQKFINGTSDFFSDRQIRFIISDHRGLPLGIADIFNFEPLDARAAVGIYIESAHRRLGLATEALVLLYNYAFFVLPLNQLYAEVALTNIASIQLFKKAGFLSTGIRTAWYRRQGTFIDQQTFQIFNSYGFEKTK